MAIGKLSYLEMKMIAYLITEGLNTMHMELKRIDMASPMYPPAKEMFERYQRLVDKIIGAVDGQPKS